MASQNLAEELHLIAIGDQQAFKRFYKQTAAKLFGVSLAILRERNLAEDVLQDTYIKVWHSASQYRADQGTAMSWVTSMVRYRAIDVLRSSDNRAISVDDIERLVSQNAVDVMNEEEADAPRLDDCLGKLQGSQRHSIHLAYLFGLTHQEISHHLGEALGSIKTWIRRGLDSLKRCLQS
ncbi:MULTISPECIES: sigma-70 family RNA polymerase sigma factor [Idiomarina]|jgi:RNA polymerase sigma-70 factor (ECF subfamily)|uniref:Sigma-70 family RNA polymerase sigma factor n=1 Tax=Idiomarina abyssalis TaxID=86102 RepID=A0A8I1KD52_9GAMM|nr:MULTISPECIES: sigma-70 family RNA polymerase sigma factor [Idiomarina]MAB21789.1 RNA polymerase subunit sigma-70 [Idiomarina sp.]MBE92545.1 RNA polymerase subunit sigma-70 [Idiomarina sp.]MBH93370.1 RNA polymerase subunit sigma-70 [Idiomarina sp.]MBJ7267844.1 sigma-70 family RNA polymerase sigma factor [Idiomarina abyssalis]MBJ7273748.1 sigma-70 family RNA polymerase sigma factor [Idiomarina abyssalis]|tara:strand:+ start:2090 stop:2626 length:537 start_codon:yes stop_codon:yes gene_type:complete